MDSGCRKITPFCHDPANDGQRQSLLPRCPAFQFAADAATENHASRNSDLPAMSNHRPIHDKIKGMPLFESFTDAELDKFLTVSDPSNFRSGEFIIRQGEDGDCMFCLAEG